MYSGTMPPEDDKRGESSGNEGDRLKLAALSALPNIWPQGLEGSREQHRDVIRVFSMGYAECLLASGDKFRWEQLCPVYSAMADPAWMPDDSWKWWA